MARKPQGHWLGIPYNWQRPKRHEWLRGLWDRDDHRIWTPRNYGWGYDLNFAEIKRRVTRRRRR
jgi:hypothetical protein